MSFARSVTFRPALALALLLVLAAAAQAQFRAGVQGTITDSAGAIVPGARVVLTNKETNQSVETVSSDGGFYRFSALAPGSYSIAVEKENFKKAVIDNLKVDAESLEGTDVVLAAGGISETVTVEAENVGLETEDASIRKTISTEEVLRLPQAGRDPYELARLAPGVFGAGARSSNGGASNLPNTTGPGGSALGIFATENQVPITANGQRVSANNFQVDGTSVNSQTWGGAAVITPSQESVKEIQVTSSTYSAEDGRNSGAQIKVVTQNGTNDFHGSAFFKYNDPGWNAFNRFYGIPGRTTTSPRRVEVRDKTFGGSIGGPIVRDRLFFFFSYEGLRNNTNNTYDAWIETPQYRQLVRSIRSGGVTAQIFGDAGIEPRIVSVLPRTCGNIGLDAARCQTVNGGLDIGSPTGALRQYVSLGNPVGGGLDGTPDIQFATLENPTSFRGHQYFTRIDYNVTSDDKVAFTGFFTPVNNFGSDTGGRSRPMADIRSQRFNWATGFIYNRIFSPTMLNEARFNITRWSYDESKTNPDTNFGIPRVEVEGLPFDRIRFGANRGEGTPGFFKETQYDFRNVFTMILGSQSIRIGGEIRRDQNDNSIVGGARPLYSFVGLWNLANDTPIFEAINASPVTGEPAAGLFQYRSGNYALFVQDDWKIRPNLTLNLGLRWEYFSPIKDANDNLYNLIFGSNGLQNATAVNVEKLHKSDFNNFGPQIGFAWSPGFSNLFGANFLPVRERFVLRGGFGLGYNRLPNAVFLNARGNPPNLARFNICCGTAPTDFGTPFAGGQILYTLGSPTGQYPGNPVLGGGINPVTNLPRVGAAEFYGSPQDQDNGEIYRYSLEGQYELPYKLVGTLGYQGSTSRKLVRIVNQNFTQPVQNPALFAVYFPTPDVNASYNALLARLQRRYANGFQFDINYRFSKSIDELSYEGPGGETNQTYPVDLDQERGPSDYDVRHNFTVSWVWDLPFYRNQRSLLGKIVGGWQISGIWTRHTGFPWTPKIDTGLRTTSGAFFGPVRPIGYFGVRPSGNSNADFLRPGGVFGNPGPIVPVAGSSCLRRNNIFVVTTLPCSGDPNFDVNVPGIGRNVFRGPKYSSVDMSISKRFGLPDLGVLGERPNLDVRFNFFNIFNNLNLGNLGFFANGTIISRGDRLNPFNNAGFGEVDNALAGRVIEFQARFSF